MAWYTYGMHQMRAVLMLPSNLQPGDKIPVGRGPWAVVERVRPALGRPPTAGRCVVIEAKNGRRRKVVEDQFLRALRQPTQ